MDQHSVFTKKHDEVVARDKNAILEELDLPPALVTFIRTHQRRIVMTIGAIFLMVVIWEGVKWHHNRRREQSAAMLYTALKATTPDSKDKALQELVKEYKGTGSAVWGQLEIGHLAFEKGEFDKAAATYRAVLGSIDADDPIAPLVRFSLAQAYENQEKTDEAAKLYLQLAETKGFAGPGYLGLARIYEKKGDREQAASYYQEYLNLPETQAAATTRQWVQAKLSRLQAA